MKTIKLSALFAALGLALTAVTSHATSPYFNYNVQATVYEQAPDTYSGTKTFYNTYKVKVTTKDILDLIAENYGHPDGYYYGDSLVEYDWSGDFYIYIGNPNKSTGTYLETVDSNLLTDYYDIIDPYSGNYNSATGSSSYTYHFVHHVMFTDLYYNNDGNYFNFTGSSTSNYVYNGVKGKYTAFNFTSGGPIEGYLWGYYFTGDATITGTY